MYVCIYEIHYNRMKKALIKKKPFLKSIVADRDDLCESVCLPIIHN